MNRRIVLATLAALLATPAVALAARGPAVTVRVEGLKRTLLAPKVVRTHAGWITRYGAPRRECPARSAQGALDVATRHRWGGTWYASLEEYEVMSILGEAHNFNRQPTYYWELFVNDVAAVSGACELKLHRGEQLLFAAVPQKGNAYVTALRAPRRVAAGHAFSVEAVWFDAKGKARPLAGAHVTGSGISATTNQSGVATLVARRAGRLVLRASHAWSASSAYIRAAARTVRVS